MHTIRSSLRCTWLLALLLVLMAAPWPAAAQPAQRWLADPALLMSARTIGPNGGRMLLDTITDIALEDGANGWATAGSGVYRLENGAWRHFSGSSSTTFLNAISLAGADVKYIVGSETERIPPYTSDVLMMRYQNGEWGGTSWVTRADGSSGLQPGVLNDVVAQPDSTAWAVGTQPSDMQDWPRPLVLHDTP